MKKFAYKVEVSKLITPLFGLIRQPTSHVKGNEPEQLTAAEIAIVAGGPEGEVVVGLPT